jgi:aspartate oxidase
MRRLTKALIGLAALCIVLSITPCESVANLTQKNGDETADVVIIGAGISGETAALELKAQTPNIKLVLLEKQATTGGSLRYSSGYIGTSSKLSRKSLHTNTVDDVLAFLDNYIRKDNVNHAFVRKLYDLSEYVTDNFITWGVDFDGPMQPGPRIRTRKGGPGRKAAVVHPAGERMP